MAEDFSHRAHRRRGWLKRISLADEQMNLLRRIVMCLALVQISFVVGTAAYAEPVMNKTDLFEAGTGGYATYRIPGIVVTSRGTLLAYCEARKSLQGDWGTIDIMMRRSTDGAKNWEKQRKIVNVDGKVTQNAVALKQNLAREGEITVKLSYDEGETWPVARSVEPGISGYSDLAVGEDGFAYCFYERGSVDTSHYRPAQLTVGRFNLEWLTDGRDRFE